MKTLVILGNQLFSPRELELKPQTDLVVFMREDFELCTYFQFHKQKIYFFLSSMRKYAEELRTAGYQVHYEAMSESTKTPRLSYEESLADFLKKKKIESVFIHEIEDKFFEKRLLKLFKNAKLESQILASPMFLTSRLEFQNYLGKSKRPFQKTFYESQRKRLKILLEADNQPVGGQWSFDQENRKALPKNYQAPALPSVAKTPEDKKLVQWIESRFAQHPGSLESLWLPTSRLDAQKWLENFLQNRLRDFGPYEDALSPDFDVLNHSVLTPFLNTGLLTPQQVLEQTLKSAKKNQIPLASLEGFVRQILGWREFIRGIYQNFSEKQDQLNFWKHERKLNSHWYQGTTGVAPLDDVIKKTLRLGYAHHIERLMVLGSLMLLLEIDPREAHRWFMEMYIDSSDWVMGPNVYGMALFSDGGIFATKPYICGSNYYKKMGPYKSGEWQIEVDGLYWGFVDKQRDFFLKNPRLAMMVRTFDKMDSEKKEKLKKASTQIKKRLTVKA